MMSTALMLIAMLAGCDGDPAPSPQSSPVDLDGDGYLITDDCDERSPDIHPGAAEVCDGVDNDCDGRVDDEDPSVSGQGTFYVDSDGDGAGDAAAQVHACLLPEGAAPNGEDCDDRSDQRAPHLPEVCDGVDNDCDEDVDENVTIIAYADRDGDGYGDENDPGEVRCGLSDDQVLPHGDCDDQRSAISPSAAERCDGVDNNCDGEVDEGEAVDARSWYADRDGDHLGDAGAALRSCSQPDGYISNDGDCDDTSAEVGAPVWWGQDSDGDGACEDTSAIVACTRPFPNTLRCAGLDCDDNDAALSPNTAEQCSDGVDNDCDGLLDCEDGDCAGEFVCLEDCESGTDEDRDGLTDCEDDDCWGLDACVLTGATITFTGGAWSMSYVEYGTFWARTTFSGGASSIKRRYGSAIHDDRFAVNDITAKLYLPTRSESCIWGLDRVAWNDRTVARIDHYSSMVYRYYRSTEAHAEFWISSGCPVQTSSFVDRLADSQRRWFSFPTGITHPVSSSSMSSRWSTYRGRSRLRYRSYYVRTFDSGTLTRGRAASIAVE